MRSRGMTVLWGAVAVVALIIGVVSAPVPYVVIEPGPTFDTLGRDRNTEIIGVSGATVSTSAGQLRLTTVGVQRETDLVRAITSWFRDDEAVVPAELIYPAGESTEQVEQRNAQDFKRSQSTAETAALRELGYPVQLVVTKLVQGGPAANALKVNDVITSVDGEPITAVARLTELVRAKPAGTTRTVAYLRGKVPGTAKITTRAEKVDDPPRLGIEVEVKQPHPFTLKIKLEDVGGPSAGLMLALGIVDKLRTEDLTGGKVIAGTGTLDDDGKVGPIGGIPQKLVAADRAGASHFLTPADNCAEATANPRPGLVLAKVGTLDEGLAALAAIRAGRTPTLC